MTKTREIFDFLNAMAPVETKMDFDNVGLLCGRGEREVTRVLLALDITDRVIEEAIAMGAELILSHHPLFFSLQSVSDATPEGRKLLTLAENGISALCMHTNLDVAARGVNTALAAALALQNPKPLEDSGLGAYGELEKTMELSEFLTYVKEKLSVSGLRYVGEQPVRRVAVLGGSGGEYFALAKALGCDTLVTADVKYHQFLSAREAKMNLLDADHFCTENPVLTPLKKALEESFPEISFEISKEHGQTVRFA